MDGTAIINPLLQGLSGPEGGLHVGVLHEQDVGHGGVERRHAGHLDRGLMPHPLLLLLLRHAERAGVEVVVVVVMVVVMVLVV